MAKELVDAGVSLLDAMLVTGHRSLDTFRRYAIRDRGAQERALIARDAAKKAQAAQQAGPVVVPFARES
jgi:hypothetical protein